MASIHCYDPFQYLSLPSGPLSWLIEPIIPVGGSAIIWASPKAGKSSLALQFSIALAKGESVLGFPIPAPAKTLFLQIDNPRVLWKLRIDKAGLTPALTPWIRFADKESCPYPFNIRQPDHAMALRQLCDLEHPDLVIIDTYREAFRGDENDSDVAQQVMSAFTAAIRPAAVLYIHHGKKPPSDSFNQPAHIDSGRGTTYIPGAVDTTMSLWASAPKKDKLTGQKLIHGTLTLKGRAISQDDIKLVQDPTTFLWRLQDDPPDPFHEALLATLADDNYETDKDRAQILADTFGRSLGSCKVAISRQRGKEGA